MRCFSSSSSDGALKKKRKFHDSPCDLTNNNNNNNNNNIIKRTKSSTKASSSSSSSSDSKSKPSSSSLFALRRTLGGGASSPTLTSSSKPFSSSVTRKSNNKPSISSSSSSSSSYQNKQFDTITDPSTGGIIKPSTYMMTTLHVQGHYVRTRPSLSMPDGFFVDTGASKKKNITTTKKNNEQKIFTASSPSSPSSSSPSSSPSTSCYYRQDMINAVRCRNVDLLRKMWKIDGRSLQCCNKFGESILHMSCRRGYMDVVQFLLDEVKLSLHVIDDCGRTPLHDLMWSTPISCYNTNSNSSCCSSSQAQAQEEEYFNLVSLIIDRAPELLFLADKRGNLPLDLVGKEHYDKWIKFIDSKNNKNDETLIPNKTKQIKQLFIMDVSSVQANKINTFIQKNYVNIIRRSSNIIASSALLTTSTTTNTKTKNKIQTE